MAGADRDLYEVFASLRQEEESRAVPFAIHTSTARRHGRLRASRSLLAAVICLATFLATAVWLIPASRLDRKGPSRGQEQSVTSVASWKPATDFLLETPGRELLKDVPAIGVWHGVALGPSPGESHRPHKKQLSQ